LLCLLRRDRRRGERRVWRGELWLAFWVRWIPSTYHRCYCWFCFRKHNCWKCWKYFVVSDVGTTVPLMCFSLPRFPQFAANTSYTGHFHSSKVLNEVVATKNDKAFRVFVAIKYITIDFLSSASKWFCRRNLQLLLAKVSRFFQCHFLCHIWVRRSPKQTLVLVSFIRIARVILLS
jgi:hypothetical protein